MDEESKKHDVTQPREAIVDFTPTSREQSLALTELELAKFWTNQALARHGISSS